MSTIWMLYIITPGWLWGYNTEMKPYTTVEECITERNALYAAPDYNGSFIFCKEEEK